MNFHLKGTHVPQHHVTNPLVVPFDVGVGASLPEESNRFACCLYYHVIRSFYVNYHTLNTEAAPTREPASGLTP